MLKTPCETDYSTACPAGVGTQPLRALQIKALDFIAARSLPPASAASATRRLRGATEHMLRCGRGGCRIVGWEERGDGSSPVGKKLFRGHATVCVYGGNTSRVRGADGKSAIYRMYISQCPRQSADFLAQGRALSLVPGERERVTAPTSGLE